MNSLQSIVEFEFLPLNLTDPFIKTISQNSKINREAIESDIPSFLERYETELVFSILGFDLSETPPDYFVLITMARLSDNYYETSRDRLSVLALGNWQRFMAPPSLLEFIITLTLKEAISASSPSIKNLYHFGTKGCLFDFTPTLDDARYKVLNAYICQNCRMMLEKDSSPGLVDELLYVLSKEWLGKPSDPMSPANITSKLGYNLFTTKGLDATSWEKFIYTIQQESVKQIIGIAGGIILAGLFLWLGLK
jgi:hypothetical protein